MKLYAVHKGRKPGIYTTWEECKKQIDGFSGPIYKKFDNITSAELFLKNNANVICLVRKSDIKFISVL